MSIFSERLVKTRKKRNITQRQLAEMLEITPTRLNYWEKGKREPDVMMINKISTTLNVRPDYLLGHIDEDVSLIKPELSKMSDLDTMLFMQNLDNALQQNAENTYIIHGAQGKGTVVKSENDKALLTGNGKTYELTQTEYEALEGVIKALRKENKN